MGLQDDRNPHRITAEFGTFARFLAVGLANTTASVGLFLIYFRILDIHYMIANVMVFLSWVWFGFELQRRWAFQTKRTRKGFSRYVTNQVIFVAIASGLLWIFVEVLKLGAEIAYVISIGIVTICMYITSRLWVFRLQQDNTQQARGKSIL